MSLLGGIVGLGQTAYNIYTDQRDHKINEQQRKWSNAITEDSLYNSAQIRRADFEKAGLHPTLMAGGAGIGGVTPPPSAVKSSRNIDMSSIMQGALIKSQIDTQKANADLLRAQADQVRQNIEYKPREHELNRLMNQSLRDLNTSNSQQGWERINDVRHRLDFDKRTHTDKIDLERMKFQYERSYEELKKQQLKMNISATEIDTLAKAFETLFMAEMGFKIPTGISNMWDAAAYLGRIAGGVFASRRSDIQNFLKSYIEHARRFVVEGEREKIQRDFMNETGDRSKD